MNIWMTLGGLLPCNKDGKWPLPVQFLAFLLFEALYIWAVDATSALVYGSSVSMWAMQTFGESASVHVLMVISSLIVMELCAWRIGLQRVIPFGGHTPRRWSILPMTLGNLALNLAAYGLSMWMAWAKLPLLTEDLLVYTAVNWALNIAVMAAFCALIYHARGGRWRAALPLAAALAVMIGLQSYGSAASMQIQDAMLNEAIDNAGPPQVTAFSYGEMPEELQGFFAGLEQEGVTIIDVKDAQSMEDVNILLPGDDRSADPFEDPFAAYEAFMAPSDRLARVLLWLQPIPIFFIMKRWLFDRPAAEESCAEQA